MLIITKPLINMYENLGWHCSGVINRQTYVWILYLPPARWVILGKSNIVSLSFLIQKMAK